MEKINFISVVITSNDQHLIEDSIKSFDHQSYPKFDFEINVVCSNEVKPSLRKLQIIRPWLHYFSIAEYSVEHAQTLGVQCTKGEIVAFTEEGCLPQYDWIEKINRHFNENPEHLCVFGVNKIGSSKIPNDSISSILTNAAFRKDTFRHQNGLSFKEINKSYSPKEFKQLLKEIGSYGISPQLKVEEQPMKRISEKSTHKKQQKIKGLYQSISHLLHFN